MDNACVNNEKLIEVLSSACQGKESCELKVDESFFLDDACWELAKMNIVYFDAYCIGK